MAIHALPGLLAFYQLSRLFSLCRGKAEGLSLRSTRQGEGTLPPAEVALSSPPPNSFLLRGVQAGVTCAEQAAVSLLLWQCNCICCC